MSPVVWAFHGGLMELVDVGSVHMEGRLSGDDFTSSRNSLYRSRALHGQRDAEARTPKFRNYKT